MERSEVEDLLNRYRIGQTSAEENALVESWYLAQGSKLSASTAEIDYEAKKKQLWEGILQKQNKQLPVRIRHWPRLAAAASIIVILGSGAYLFLKKDKDPGQNTIAAYHDIAPGSNKAILTLSNGSQITLGNQGKRTLATQGNTIVTQNSPGSISYSALKNNPIAATDFNTISTPKGGEYQVVLPDGTHVWLNAASSLKYPVAFAGKERKVELRGEAYFEVAHNKAKPFKVISGTQSVEVLGTHFNINAYTDEVDIRTTLLEGAVKVSKNEKNVFLKPGQQALVNSGITVDQADVNVALAWKNGRTYFKDADIPKMMRSLARWYNVDVEYRGTIPARVFTGGIPRKSSLSTMLKILEEMNIHAHIEGRKIIVTP